MSEFPSMKTASSLGFHKAQVYSFMDFDPDDYEESHAEPPLKNLFSAAIHVGKLIQDAGFEYALLGGAALATLGSRRETVDLDICTNAEMIDLWRILDDRRVILPDTKLVSDMIRCFVYTGPDYGDDFTDENIEIQVDIMTPGGHSVPRHIEECVQKFTVQVGDRSVELATLDTYTLLRSKLAVYSARQERKDFTDCCFLLETLDLSPEKADQLDVTCRQQFLESDFFADLLPERARLCQTKLQA